jgi:hypothetical protein
MWVGEVAFFSGKKAGLRVRTFGDVSQVGGVGGASFCNSVQFCNSN